MVLLYRLRAIFMITFKRLWAQRSLTAATLLGLVTAVALIMTVPLYADAVYFRILQEELSTNADRSRKPPFAYMYDYVGSWAGPVQWEDIQSVDSYLLEDGARALGLPAQLTVRHLETDRFRLYPADTTNYANEAAAFGTFSFATTTYIADHIEIVEGAYPNDGANPLEILISEEAASTLGLQVGDNLVAYDYAQDTSNPLETAVRVAGVWRAADPETDFWFFRPPIFDDLMLVSEPAFVEQLSPMLNNEITRAVWYLVLDGSSVNTSNADALVARSAQVERRAENLLPKVRNVITPADGLRLYRTQAEQLTILLTAFNVPVIGLILAFIGLIVGLAVNQRRNEIAVMRSRGGTPAQVMGLALVEGLLLGTVALGLGVIAALGLV
ncbi:MAG: hypothetical protein KDE51_16430, partial [Anaerolineales bacterium]|nr:hypothetical protein [Anaerolineales bacterium]